MAAILSRPQCVKKHGIPLIILNFYLAKTCTWCTVSQLRFFYQTIVRILLTYSLSISLILSDIFSVPCNDITCFAISVFLQNLIRPTTKMSKLLIVGLWERKPPMDLSVDSLTKGSNAKSVSITWRHHEIWKKGIYFKYALWVLGGVSKTLMSS